MTTSRGAAGNGSPRLFSAAERLKILSRVVGEPSGVMVEIGGIEFNLIAVSSDELIGVLDLLSVAATMYEKIKRGEGDNVEIAAFLASDGKKLVNEARAILFRSARLDRPDVDPADIDLFDEWWARVPIIATLKTLAPKILEANGMLSLVRPTPAPAPGAEQPSPTPST